MSVRFPVWLITDAVTKGIPSYWTRDEISVTPLEDGWYRVTLIVKPSSAPEVKS